MAKTTLLLTLLTPLIGCYEPIQNHKIPAEHLTIRDQILAQATSKWGAQQASCLDRILTQESHYNPLARNRKHLGIFQQAGGRSTDWQVQTAWGLNYIARRYKNPCRALAHKTRKGWY